MSRTQDRPRTRLERLEGLFRSYEAPEVGGERGRGTEIPSWITMVAAYTDKGMVQEARMASLMRSYEQDEETRYGNKRPLVLSSAAVSFLINQWRPSPEDVARARKTAVLEIEKMECERVSSGDPDEKGSFRRSIRRAREALKEWDRWQAKRAKLRVA